MDAARRVRWAGALCVAILALGVSLAAAAPGDLDSSFNGTGTRSFHYGAGPNDTAVTALIQPGGKIVLSGEGQQPSNTEQDAVVGRLNLNGSTDSTFGSGGTGATSLDFGDPFSDGAAAFAPDGKIVVTGEIARSGTDTTVAGRLNADGTPDTSWGPGGTRELLDTGFERPSSVAVQSSGKPVIFGVDTSGHWAVSRLNATNGEFDSTFGTASGQTIVSVGGPPGGVALDAGDKIVLVGSAKGASGLNMFVARLNSDGTPDPTFNGGTAREIGPGVANAVAVQPDHRIVIVGDTGTGPEAMRVVRLNSDGSSDTSFGSTAGTVDITFAPGQNADGGAVAIQPDGKILAAGDTGDDFAVARLQPSGAFDSTFSSDGKQTVDFSGDMSSADTVALEPDGSMVLAGVKAGGAVAVARLQGDAGAAGGGGGGPGGATGGNGSPPRCGGKRATIVGTSHANHLKGTRHADVIAGLGGNDKISGLGGNDIICGGSGNDTISGGSGKDKLTGGTGKDSLNGGSGKDRCAGHDHKRSC